LFLNRALNVYMFTWYKCIMETTAVINQGLMPMRQNIVTEDKLGTAIIICHSRFVCVYAADLVFAVHASEC